MNTATKEVIAVIIALVIGFILYSASDSYANTNVSKMQEKTDKMYEKIGD